VSELQQHGSGAAEGEGGEKVWRLFTGNETAILLAWWQLVKKSGGTDFAGADLSGCAMVGSTVSTHFLATMAKADGFDYHETLTGFKWMGNRAVELAAGGKDVLLCFEEAIGYAVGGMGICDKDGISAAVAVVQLAEYLQEHCGGRTLSQQLIAMFDRYGKAFALNSYFFCHDPAAMVAVFDGIRNGGDYVSAVGAGGKFAVSGVRDLGAANFDSSTPDKLPTLPNSASSYMVTLSFANGTVVTVRGSGTEPKLKYYSEMVGPNASQEELKELVDAVIAELLKPEERNLLPPPSSK
jgi:phosphomannomutase